jgi:hypothetical protein
MLLIGFFFALAANLAMGRKPKCHCFGQLHSSRIGVSTAALNLGLIALAALVFSSPSPSLLPWLVTLKPSHLLGPVVVVAYSVLIFLIWQMIQQQGRLLLRLDNMEAQLRRGDASASA